MMVEAAPSTDVAEEERDIWDDAEVLHFIQTHKYPNGLSAKSRDRIYLGLNEREEMEGEVLGGKRD